MTPLPARAVDAPAAAAPGAPRIAIVGAGPAGLAAGWELSKLGRRATVYEKDRALGGISRTAEYRGFRFDLGGHRFFTKSEEVQRVWEEILGGELLERPRLSRIYYRGRFFDYPLRPLNALFGLGPLEATRIFVSYVHARLFPDREERTFDAWVSNRFGRRLFEIFFATYTEKVWGIPCSEISSDWAAQRIKNLDLLRAVRTALFGSFGTGVITTLIDRFQYPRFGPGMMWERCAERLAERGTPTELGREVSRIRHRDGRVVALELRGDDGSVREEAVDEVICSMPLGRAATLLDPAPPEDVLAAARGLRHRDFLTVVLIVDAAELFPDNWIYVHSPEVRVGRIQNFKNWSPEMVPDPGYTALGLEYFVQRGDELWNAADEDLIALGSREIHALGLADRARVVDGTVVRVPAAYPLYDAGYAERVAAVRAHLESFENLQMVGRNGQHRYNNQDHSMLTGIFAARNLAGQRHDVWSVNVDGDYHEEVASRRGDRAVPGRVGEPTVEELLVGAFQRYDAVALGAAMAATSALTLFSATAVLLLRGSSGAAEPTLHLLAAYLAGFDVSWSGALVGCLEAGVLGYLLGFLTARAVNLQVARAERALMRELTALGAVDALDGAAL